MEMGELDLENFRMAVTDLGVSNLGLLLGQQLLCCCYLSWRCNGVTVRMLDL